MKLYIVVLNTYTGYGIDYRIFGVFSKKDKAENTKKELIEKYKLDYYSEPDIIECDLDKKCNLYIGSYTEEMSEEDALKKYIDPDFFIL